MSCSISICIRTKDWTMGYWCGCSLLIREGYKATVEWGDGKLHKVTGSSEWIYVTHEYPKPILLYVIRISTEEDDALWGFQDAMHEVDVLDFDCSGCPSLRFLGFSYLEKLDVSCNLHLERLVCNEGRFTTLDLSQNAELKMLDCHYCPKLVSLDLTSCNRLERLNCWLCGSLFHIALNNQSVLEEVNYGDTCLCEKSEKHLLRLIDRNGEALFDSLFNMWND